MNETHKTVEWIEICNNACEKMGRTLRPGKKLEGWIKDAGFSNVQVSMNRIACLMFTSPGSSRSGPRQQMAKGQKAGKLDGARHDSS